MRRATRDRDNTEDTPVRRRRSVPWRRLAPGTCWVLVLGWAAFAFVRTFGLERTWVLDTLIAFTPYATALALVPLLFALALRRWRATVVAVVTLLVLVTALVPRFIGHPEPGHGPALRVMSANMKVGAADPATIVALVRAHGVDLLALQEFTPAAQHALDLAGLDALLPFSQQQPVPDGTGSALFSRYPLSATGNLEMPGGFWQTYGTVTVPGALPVVVFSVHPCAPSEPSRIACWNRGLADEPAATPHGAVRLLIGDFNSSLDHSGLRTLLDTGYRDVASELGDGLTATWPYDGRPLPVITLDHVFADPRIGIASFRVDAIPHTDHRSIFAALTLPPA